MTTRAPSLSRRLAYWCWTALKSLVTGLAAVVLLLTGLVAVEAQQAVRVYRIGFVSPLSRVPEPSQLHAFRQGLRELGYVDGKNVIIEARFAEGRNERLPELVAELLRMKVDVLLAGSTPGALAAKKATTTVPVVFAGVTDPISAGIVSSLARPGGNITGAAVGAGGMDFAGKWVELLKEAVPGVSHVAVLSNSASPSSAPFVPEIQLAARTLNVKLQVLEAGNPANLDKAFAAIGASGANGIIVTGDPFFVVSRAKIAQFAASKRLPAVHWSKLFAESGGLMSYGASIEESYRRAATYVDKILKGTSLPIFPSSSRQSSSWLSI